MDAKVMKESIKKEIVVLPNPSGTWTFSIVPQIVFLTSTSSSPMPMAFAIRGINTIFVMPTVSSDFKMYIAIWGEHTLSCNTSFGMTMAIAFG